jgi:hypothetical protein
MLPLHDPFLGEDVAHRNAAPSSWYARLAVKPYTRTASHDDAGDRPRARTTQHLGKKWSAPALAEQRHEATANGPSGTRPAAKRVD